MKLKLQTVFMVIFVSVFILAVTSLPVSAASSANLVGSSIVADIAENSSPSVVCISTTYESKKNPASLFGDSQENSQSPPQGLGSGFFFNENGYILTNAHVVTGAKTIEVILKDQKNPIKATLIGKDQELDVAIIKVDLPQKTPYLKLGNSDKARIGDWAIAIGNPFGLDHTVTLGIISYKGRPIMAGQDSGMSQVYDNMIQTDAAINPGNSGGPLLNINGDVVGINTAVSTSGQGLSFAIPINSVKEILDELKTKGKVSHPWVGVQLLDLKAVNAEVRSYLGIDRTDGVLIRSVLKNSPAAKAGLQPYDVVLEINHQAVAGSDEFIKMIHLQKVSDKVSLLILRKGDLIKAEVTLEEKPE